MTPLLQFTAIALATVLVACKPKPETLVPQIQQEAQNFLNALSTANEREVKQQIYPDFASIVPGGVAAYLKTRVKSLNALRSNGFAMKSANVGVPEVPQIANGYYVAFVPAKMHFLPDNGGNIGQTRLFGPNSLTLHSYVVAVSTNKGRTWRFFEPQDTREIIDKTLPKVAAKLVIPGELIKMTKD